ncbi:MAG TPA: nucleotidyltransferase domain-containing protein [Mesotoga sp.]|nr:nucleotidyltransferase domain-containing protein [Mesotoga sp.]
MAENDLNLLLDQIVQLASPIRVLLFGSRARGEDSVTSDYDLLVIVKDGEGRRSTAQMLYRKIEGVRTPFDLIVATENDLVRYADNPFMVFNSALKEGIELYAS